MRGSPVVRESSSERIVSMSVTKRKREECQFTRAHSSHRVKGKRNMPGAQQPQAYGNGEIVTLPPPFSSDVLIEQRRGELLSEEVLHKLFDQFCHGQTTNDRGYYTGNTDILRGDGSR